MNRTTFLRPSVLLFFFLFITASLPLFALRARLVSTDTTVVYQSDGTADIMVQTDWQVTDGDMHGFYFQGEEASFDFNTAQCWFENLDGNERIPLSIQAAGSGRYDVVLAGGRAFSGKGLFVLTYHADFRSANMTGLTRAQNGVFFYFDWAAAQWDDSMESRTTRIVLPIAVPATSSTESAGAISGGSESQFIHDIGLLTERETTRQNAGIKSEERREGKEWIGRAHV
jgi:hypothetical protein